MPWFKLLRRAHSTGWMLTAEATTELVFARLVTLLPASIYLRNLGPGSYGDIVSVESGWRAQRIGQIVESVARRLPVRALCLQQAIATRRMLMRRQLPATMYLGVSTRREDRAVPGRGLAAHAWVCVDGKIVCGDGNLARYAVVARFPDR